MPELPEVETTRRGVAPRVVGRRVKRLQVYDARLRWPVPADLAKRIEGRVIDRVDRRSKYLLFRFGDDTLLVHLGMTGSLRVHRKAPPRVLHDHVDLMLDDGTTLRYHDPRRFGAMLWVEGPADSHPLLRALGPEPFDASFNAEHCWNLARGRNVAVKLALMDNRMVVGVGNIYASEALFRAGIRPTARLKTISRARFGRLVEAVRAVLEEAIASGGSTLRDYVGSQGERGQFQFRHDVYARKGDPCRVCGTPIRMIRQGQRASFYCPRCQR
ncbi:MAG TPA: bifunctional DNA-formamidopyrimidine glycosylase/DNA-(apurinic or apyrimidinic site) lyase [Casimicrobiaceae bacterium]|nr:bifunctional DNA-formamidopyrimidine glycosylase/DNA-(apurinic or apyrimidinic site) lyase [Casimicrobiaceae bacterium]